MKILWISTKEKDDLGHTEHFGLVKSLVAQGHEVTVILASKGKRNREGYIQYVSNPFGRKLFFRIKLAFCLLWWCVYKRPDFIILEWSSAYVAAIVLVCVKLKLVKNNLIHDIRTLPVPAGGRHRRKVFDMCVNLSKKHFLGITTITQALKDTLCSEYGVSPQKVGVWASGVDLDLFYPKDGTGKRRELGFADEFIVFYHGSIAEKRGVVELVQAFGLLKHSDDIHLFILGSGPGVSAVYKAKEREKLGNVHIHQPVEYQDVPDYIAMSDVCVVPLPDEECWRVSSPLKVMEYLAMGKPIILTDITAHRGIIHNEADAVFVRDTSPATLAGAIVRAYSSRDELARMRAVGLENARENCSWNQQAERLVEFLVRLQSSTNPTADCRKYPVAQNRIDQHS